MSGKKLHARMTVQGVGVRGSHHASERERAQWLLQESFVAGLGLCTPPPSPWRNLELRTGDFC